MSINFLRVLPAVALSFVAFSFSGCAATGGIGGPLASALGDITGFSTNISNWQSKLGGMVDGTALGQLQEYASKATNLGDTVKSMTAGASKAMRDPLGAIGSKLTDMGGINVDQLKSLAPAAQMDAVEGFTANAKGVGTLAQDFLKQFGG
jgi:hypothetical protein